VREGRDGGSEGGERGWDEGRERQRGKANLSIEREGGRATGREGRREMGGGSEGEEGGRGWDGGRDREGEPANARREFFTPNEAMKQTD